MQHRLRDRLEPRDWKRIDRESPGLICCCTSGASAYTLGGSNFGATVYATTDKTSFSAETTAAVAAANLSIARAIRGNGVSNPATAGYVCGGASSARVVTADKLVFASDTTSAVSSANLSSARDSGGALSERSTKGYIAGGQSTANSVTADKLTFSGDTTAATSSANLSLARRAPGALSEGTSKGYFAGGFSNAPAVTWVKTAEKITFSTDTTTATATANLSTARGDMACGSDGTTKGYFYEGQNASPSTVVDKITFSTDTTALAGGGALHAIWAGAASSDGTNIFIMGGADSLGSNPIGSATKFIMATEVSSAMAPAAALSVARGNTAGLSTVGL